MSKRIGNLTVTAAEADDICECFSCGMKNPEQTDKMMGVKLFGDPENVQ